MVPTFEKSESPYESVPEVTRCNAPVPLSVTGADVVLPLKVTATDPSVAKGIVVTEDVVFKTAKLDSFPAHPLLVNADSAVPSIVTAPRATEIPRCELVSAVIVSTPPLQEYVGIAVADAGRDPNPARIKKRVHAPTTSSPRRPTNERTAWLASGGQMPSPPLDVASIS